MQSTLYPRARSNPIGFSMSIAKILFDIKMEDFPRKACLVVGGNMIHAPDTITHSSVVMREIVHMTLTMVVLHDLKAKAAGILKAYVMAPNHEKIWTVLGPEFGDNAGKSAIKVRALYRLKSVGAFFHAHLSQCIQELGYCPYDMDPDLWMKAWYRPEDSL